MAYNIRGSSSNYNWTQIAMVVISAMAGIVACMTWRKVIFSYRQLNSARFEIIHLLESKLPARLFDYEWQILEQEKQYKPLTLTEINVPVVFMAMYILIAICVMLQVFVS